MGIKHARKRQCPWLWQQQTLQLLMLTCPSWRRIMLVFQRYGSLLPPLASPQASFFCDAKVTTPITTGISHSCANEWAALALMACLRASVVVRIDYSLSTSVG